METRQQRHGHGGLIFMSSVALVFSTLGLLLSGFLAYQFFDLRQEVREVSNALNQTAAISPNLANPAQSPISQSQAPEEGVTPTPSTPAQAHSGSTGIQPGQFVQLAYDRNVRIELLSVQRSQNSGGGERGEYVNVKMRLRALRNPSGSLYPAEITARNPESTEPYESYEAVSEEYATESINISKIPQSASVDAQVWLRVPEGVNTIDIYMPLAGAKTKVFKNVPISG